MSVYSPNINLLTQIINKKNQQSNDLYDYYIGIRHHRTPILLVDKIINILVSHFDSNIYIYVSTSKNLLKEITNNMPEIIHLCNYINFNESGNDYNEKMNIDTKVLLLTCKNIDIINFNYFIYHSQSEYYCKTFKKTEFSFQKKELKTTSEDAINKFNSLKGWWWDTFKRDKTCKYLLSKNLLLFGHKTNGILVSKQMLKEFIVFYNDICKINVTENFCSVEIYLPTFIHNYWSDIVSLTTVVCWDLYSNDPRKWDERILERYINDVKTDNVTYYAIKKVDLNNSNLLKYLHKTYMTEQINTILNTI
jgi:hypothetical protein